MPKSTARIIEAVAVSVILIAFKCCKINIFSFFYTYVFILVPFSTIFSCALFLC